MKKNCLFFLLIVFFSFQTFAQNFETHKVKQGETVSSLAKKYDVSEKSIYKFNPDAKKGNLVGTVLVIPVGKSTDVRNLETPSVLNFKEYKVKRRETLYSIAKKNDISVDDLKKYNNYLYNNELGKGDVIKIPVFSEKDTININNSVQNSTFENLKHIVLPKEGKLAIARKYGMTLEQLNTLNPGVNDLQPGQVLNVINPQNKDSLAAQQGVGNSDNFISYTVQPKENYYRLTKRFNTTKEALIANNPILEEEGLEAGMTIKIPKPNNMVGDSLVISNTKIITLENYITNRSKKNLAIMLPFSLDKFKSNGADKEEILKNDRVTRVSLDFYSGVVSAIDSVQKLGIPINAKIFDTEKSGSKLDEILRNNDFSNYQAVIGPLLTNNVEKASKFFNKYQIPVFSPLIDAELNGEENLFQTRPSQLMMEKTLITYIDSLKEGKNLIILADDKHEYLKSKLSYTFPEAKVVTQKKAEYMQNSDLIAVLSKEKENWFILESDDLELISNATSYLNALSTRYKIRVFTSDKSEPYEDEISNAYLSNLNFTYASVSKECETFEENSFVKSYIQDYGILPSKFATRGFDLTYDLILRLAVDDDFYKGLELEGVSEHVENKFSYHKKMIGGYYNDAAYLIKYEEGLKLKVVN
ncbi:amino acid/amide ABC transporter substrate-binding protein, HAAT family [Mesonia phycicola]|uniref:Amino acid/amide ABC transporter substrate-binding protein, HAAT family n=1 Tax=Mesonia phycicola TaxID=579105 RepID=A0A1M6DZS0_9FLAO|nr:LysM peptidoglycan-binding domain-containing protein [Mesonia phycicola]SHI78747.1 amino acid/amide ABC transporter substrate-binding protein, HAAT family [Mesonia phycicola]